MDLCLQHCGCVFASCTENIHIRIEDGSLYLAAFKKELRKYTIQHMLTLIDAMYCNNKIKSKVSYTTYVMPLTKMRRAETQRGEPLTH